MGGIAGVLSSFNTQPPEGGWAMKNAGMAPTLGFNTQPPEGGWVWRTRRRLNWDCFNTQPPEGGWGSMDLADGLYAVSTHSRPKAAGSWKSYKQ